MHVFRVIWRLRSAASAIKSRLRNLDLEIARTQIRLV